jgi:hypothetical protein
MTDAKRIKPLIEAIRAFQEERFAWPPVDPGDDEIAELNRAVRDLGARLEERFVFDGRLNAIIERVQAGVRFEEVLSRIYDFFRGIIPYDRIGCALIDQEKNEVTACWHRADYDPILLRDTYHAPLTGSSLHDIVETGQPRIINDLEEYLATHPESQSTRLILREGILSNLTCPLVVLDKPVGFLFFSSRAKGAYDGLHVETFLRIANQVSTAVEKSRLYDQVLELSATKDRFLGMVAHDLRNPLSVIGGFAIMASREKLGPLTPKLADSLALIKKNAATMAKMIEDLLDINVIESGRLELKREPTPIAELLEEKAKESGLLGEGKSIRITLEAAGDLPTLTIDRQRIGQVLDNLLSNAIKYSHAETTVTLAARRETDGLVIEIRDQGQGIPPAEIPKLFRHFGKTSVKPTAGEKSIGLGLAIIKKIVEAHGGTVDVESVVGQGSTFRFRLPLETP